MVFLHRIHKKFALLVGGTAMITLGGCIPSGLGRDLFTSTAAAVVGDIVFTILDFILPRPM